MRPKPGNAPLPVEVRLTKQIVILGNQIARLEKIVKTQAIKTEEALKLMSSKSAVSMKADYSVAYWIVGGLSLLAILFGVVLLLSAIAIAIYKKIRG